jgi:hypothetical protein
VAEYIMASGIVSQKGEYETSAEYADRQKSIVLPPQPMAFLLNGRGRFGYGGSIKTAYDADRQVLSIILELFKRTIDGSDIYGTYDLDGTILYGDHYLGANAYGATADVTQVIAKSYSLAVENGTWLTLRNPGYAMQGAKVTLPIKLSPEKAKDLAGNIGVLLVGNLQTPWVSRSLSVSTPTLENPSDVSDIRAYLHIDPTAVWLIDIRTGEVLFKFSEHSLAEQLNYLEEERRLIYPLRLDISGDWAAFITYAADDGEEVKGEYFQTYGAMVRLPATIEAKHRITVKIADKYSYEAYRDKLIFKVNEIPVKPKWHISKNPFLAEAIFELPN